MPRKIPTQVDQSLSRLLRGGYLKEVPPAYPTMLHHPPSAIPPRHAFEPIPGDVPSTSATMIDHDLSENRHRNRLNSSKKAHTLMPKLFPQPIVYLADRVRQRFYEDHPWESFRPRSLVEGYTLQTKPAMHPSITNLAAWSRNPGPEDVVACTLHLHKHHRLSLAQAYHHTLSSYHALRAEHEHATRAATLEATAYGAVFALSTDGRPTAAVEIERGYRKEAKELEKGAEYFKRMFVGTAESDANGQSSSITDARTGAIRVKSASQGYSKGHTYLKAALEARDGVHKEVKDASKEEKDAVMLSDGPSEVSIQRLDGQEYTQEAERVPVLQQQQGR